MARKTAAHKKKTRVLALILLLSVAGAAPAGCARQPAAAPACRAVADAVLASQSFEETTELSKEKMSEFLDIDPAALTDLTMEMDVSRATAECVIALTAVDTGALKALETALREYRDTTLAQYRDYQPAEVPKLETAVLRTNGLQTVLVVCGDAAKAQRALDNAWR